MEAYSEVQNHLELKTINYYISMDNTGATIHQLQGPPAGIEPTHVRCRSLL